jgi:phage shock protein C
MTKKKLFRAREKDSMVAGVCAGLADYFDFDVTWVRLFWVFASLVWGAGVLVYLIFWVVVPRKN